MYAIFKKELRTYFTTLTGFIFLGFFVLVSGFYFSVINILSGEPLYNNTIAGTIIMFLILVPVTTMRLFAEEVRQKTDQLLFTSPVSIYKIVLGKFFAAAALYLIGIIITCRFPLILSRFGEIPVKATIGGLLGYFLMCCCFISIGIFISVLTENQIIAAVATFAAMFFIFMIDGIASSMPADALSSVIFVAIIVIGIAFIVYNSTKNIYAGIIVGILGLAATAVTYFVNSVLFDGIIVKVLGWFSILSRFDNFCFGVFQISDIVYYITFCIAFLYFTVNAIEKRRWR